MHVETDDQECGACRSLGGRDCSRIEHALATSCRRGGCVVRKPCLSSAARLGADHPSFVLISVLFPRCRRLPRRLRPERRRLRVHLEDETRSHASCRVTLCCRFYAILAAGMRVRSFFVRPDELVCPLSGSESHLTEKAQGRPE